MAETDQVIPEESEPQQNSSPFWGRSTKIVVIVAVLLLAALTAWRFQGLIIMTVTAGVIAFIINPLINSVNQRTRISRGWVILLIYLVLALAVVWLFVALGVAAYEQAGDLIELIPNLFDQIVALLESLDQRSEPVVIFDQFTIDPVQLPWDSITNQILGLVEPTLSTSGQFLRQIATTTVRTVGNFLFVFVISIYLAIEFPHFGKYIDSAASQPGYRDDAKNLSKEFGRIWDAFLRGQVILGVVIFVVVWLGLSLLGVRNSLTLGLLSGILEFIPTLGPVIGTGVAMMVAFFQPQNPWGLESWQFALIVLVFMIIVQQIENNLLVPRIVGGALDLHPLIVIIGVLMGASLAGILGAVLAAPILASLKLVGQYVWRKLFDLPPFPVAEERPDLMESLSPEQSAESIDAADTSNDE
ncbi:MAG: AI-2E family transporter [Chloroflexi bacterium]|jgi:predicted PurR-regulated permease PerM|nr:AI-2E family transporter [Chloroflexota bacterium]